MSKGLWAALSCALVSAACVVSPHHGEHTGTRATPINFEIYATKASAALSITCSHHYGNVQTIDNFTGGTNPINYGGETVFSKKRTLTLPSSCWEPWAGSGYNFITYLRVKQDDKNAAVFDELGLDCLWEAIGDGTGPITAGFDCKRDGADILVYAN